MRGVLVFGATCAADFCWAHYIRATAHGRAGLAAFWSAVIVGLGVWVTVAVVASHGLAVPAMLGAYAGTWIAVKVGS